MTQTTTGHVDVVSTATARPPMVSGFSHLSLAVRDLAEGVRWFQDVLSASLVNDNTTFKEVKLGSVIVGLSPQPSGWTAPDAEFPHYAFFIEPEDFVPLKERLEAFGIPTHPIWTRHHKEALMYFRDPSGNLFELYCTKGFKGVEDLPLPPEYGGDFEVNFRALTYDTWG